MSKTRKLTNEERYTITSEYVDQVVENMSTKDLIEFVTDTITKDLNESNDEYVIDLYENYTNTSIDEIL